MKSRLMPALAALLVVAGPAAAQTAAEIELQTKAAAARKAEADAALAEINLRNAQINVPSSGVTGRVTETSGAAMGEERLLAARALNGVSDCIAPRVRGAMANFQASPDDPAKWMAGSGCARPADATGAPALGSPARVLLFVGDERPTLDSWLTYKRREQQLDAAFTAAAALFQAASDQDDALKAAGGQEMAAFLPLGALGALGTIGTGVSALSNLIGFFGSEYSVGGAAITPDNTMFESSLTRALLTQGIEVRRPGRAVSLGLQSEMSAKFAAWDDKAATASGQLALAQAMVKLYEKDPRKAAPWIKAAGALQNAITASGAMYTWLAGADPKGGLVLGRVLADGELSRDLNAAGRKTYFLFITVSSASGSHYSRRNLWTVFGGMPFWAMGSVVVGYQLVDPVTKVTFAADQIPYHGGYRRVNEVAAVINGN